ncbi:MAG: YCF48-related protein [bacterium]
MKSLKIISLFLLIIIASCDSSSEPPVEKTAWKLLSAQNDNNSYYSIFFIDENNGWIAGDNAVLKKSVDGGITWQLIQSGVTSNLHDIQFIDSQNGWACGSENTIIKTTDSGSSWQNISVPSEKNKIFLLIKFIDKNSGWTISNHGDLYKTTDGGNSWLLKKEFREMGAQLSVVDENNVFVCQGKFYKTSDSGANWDSSEVSMLQDFTPCDMHFVSKNNGILTTMYIGGAYIQSCPVLFTKDGGVTWSQSGYIEKPCFRGCAMISETTGWVAAYNHIYKTTDGGYSWLSDFTLENEDMHTWDMYFLRDKICGWIITHDGAIYKCETVEN